MYRIILSLLLISWLPASYSAGILDQLDSLSTGDRKPHREFLPADQAFVFEHDQTADGLNFHFTIAPQYYLYRERMKFEALSPELHLGTTMLPASETKNDPEFGRVEIYRNDVDIRVPINSGATTGARLRVTYQGCAEDGICYPPIKKEISLDALTTITAPTVGIQQSTTDRIAGDLKHNSLLRTMGWFFAAGLALALTPCVFPMVPILSGIIVGQRRPASTARSLALASVYVLAMAGTYATVGVIAGLFGRNLQVVFQQPAVLIAFSLIFVALALAMFGFFNLQMPSFVQTRAASSQLGRASGNWFGVALMGSLSAIIVGPCVAPPLAAAIIYLGHQGSPVVGGAALFALGLGMGVPLLAIGASAGHWLPRAGAWMENVKRAFGVVFLGLAIWFLDRILPAAATLALWGILLIGSAMFLGALEPIRESSSGGWPRFWKGMGLSLLCYGTVLIVGAGAGATDPLRPLAPLIAVHERASSVTHFMPVKGADQFDLALAAARAAGKPVLVDFYADWCVECKRLERNTFSDPNIQALLNEFVLLRADVTVADPSDDALLKRFELLGPPAVLFFDTAGNELRPRRLIGYLDSADFSVLLAAAYPR